MMNKKLLKSLVFPALTIFFLMVAWVTGGEDFITAIKGTATKADVTALVRCYDKQCDLIVDIEQELTMTQADGTVFSATANRDGIVNADQFSENQLAAINTVKGTKSDAVGRFLLRENDKQTDDRIVDIVRTERTQLLQDLPGPINHIEIADDGRVAAVIAGGKTLQAADGDSLVTRIQFSYIGGSEEAAEMKTDVKTIASRTLNGELTAHESEDFILYEKDYRYVFRAVFAYTGEFGSTATVSDVGARKGPRTGHGIGSKLLIAYMPGNPEQATILSNFAQLKGMKPLDAINRFFELTFGRWFFPAVSLLVAFVYLIMSIITVPLMLKPPKTENADTVDEELLAKMQ
jgi:hypothetical protein